MPVRQFMLLLLPICGGCITFPDAELASAGDRQSPTRAPIHFVEDGRRGRGVLIDYQNWSTDPLNASGGTVIVEVLPTEMDQAGLARKRSTRTWLREVDRSPGYRGPKHLRPTAGSVRVVAEERTVWVLGTHPVILAFSGTAPRRPWQELAKLGTGRIEPDASERNHAERWVSVEELGQPITKLVVFPSVYLTDSWNDDFSELDVESVSVVTLAEPMTIDDALDAIAAGDPLRLGTVAPHPPLDKFGVTDPLDDEHMKQSKAKVREKMRRASSRPTSRMTQSG